MGLVWTDDVVERPELRSEGVFANGARAVTAPAPQHGTGCGVVDGDIARVGDGQDVLAGGWMSFGGTVDVDRELERFGHGVGRKARIAAGLADPSAEPKVPP